MRIDTTTAAAMNDQTVDRIDVGSGTAALQLRTGNVATGIGDAAAGTLLATFALPNPAFGASSAGTATANAITPVEGVAAGTVGHWRVVNRNGDCVMDENYATGSLVLNTTTISVGVDVTVISWTVTQPTGAA